MKSIKIIEIEPMEGLVLKAIEYVYKLLTIY